MIGDGEEDEVRFDWRRGGAAAAGLVAALILVAMVVPRQVRQRRARDRRSTAERHAYEVALIVRNVKRQHLARRSGAGRFVLDEDVETERQYLRQRLAACRLPDRAAAGARCATTPSSCGASHELQQLYDQRGERARRSPPARRSQSRATPGSAISTQRRQDAEPAGDSDDKLERDHRRRARVAARPDRAEPVLLRPGRPVHRLSELARDPRRPRRRSSSASSRSARCARTRSRASRPKARPSAPKRSSRRCASARRSCGKRTRR